MIAQETFREMLRKAFKDKQETNPSYSLRAFSRDLSQHPAAISQIFSGKRHVSRKLALLLAEKSDFSEKQVDEVKLVFDFDKQFSASFNKSIPEVPLDTIPMRLNLEPESIPLVKRIVQRFLASLAASLNQGAENAQCELEISIMLKTPESVLRAEAPLTKGLPEKRLGQED